MIRKIIEYSIKHKLMVALLVVTIIIGGLWAMKTISVDSTPDITNNQVQVITVAQNRPIGKVPWLGRPIQSAKYRNYTIEKE